MVKFRHHRGNLFDSMETEEEIETLEECKSILEFAWKIPIQEVKQEYYCYDERIDWDTWIITIKVNDKIYVAGFSNGKLD